MLLINNEVRGIRKVDVAWIKEASWNLPGGADKNHADLEIICLWIKAWTSDIPNKKQTYNKTYRGFSKNRLLLCSFPKYGSVIPTQSTAKAWLRTPILLKHTLIELYCPVWRPHPLTSRPPPHFLAFSRNPFKTLKSAG
jgi:hypothetical protein